MLLAYRHVAANEVTGAEYSGLIGTMLLGWILFAEAREIWFVVGTAMIVTPLVLLSLNKHKRMRNLRLANGTTR